MAYYTLNQIKPLRKSISGGPIFENINRINNAKARIFLSHSHKDKDIIEDALAFLLMWGQYVYVDWLDDSMPSITSVETANKIQTKIKTLDKFVVLLTENSKESKWVPWELGYADGVKKLDNIAILPILRSQYGNFNGVEYMNLYPTISEGKNNYRTEPAIFPPKDVGISGGMFLREGWLKEKNSNFIYGQ